MERIFNIALEGAVSFLSDVATGKSALAPVNDFPLTHLLATLMMLNGSHTKRTHKSRRDFLRRTFSARRKRDERGHEGLK